MKLVGSSDNAPGPVVGHVNAIKMSGDHLAINARHFIDLVGDCELIGWTDSLTSGMDMLIQALEQYEDISKLVDELNSGPVTSRH